MSCARSSGRITNNERPGATATSEKKSLRDRHPFRLRANEPIGLCLGFANTPSCPLSELTVPYSLRRSHSQTVC